MAVKTTQNELIQMCLFFLGNEWVWGDAKMYSGVRVSVMPIGLVRVETSYEYWIASLYGQVVEFGRI